jgi:uncharacterized RDD family membrane protein YckC
MAQRFKLFTLRLLAGLYDAILIFVFALGWSALAILFNQGEAITENHPAYRLFQMSLALIPVVYFSYFFTRSGQTLGMRAWKLKLSHLHSAQQPTLNQSLARLFLFTLTFGIGFLWLLFSRQNQSLYDQLLSLNVTHTSQDTP